MGKHSRYKPLPLWGDGAVHLSVKETQDLIYTNTVTPLKTIDSVDRVESTGANQIVVFI
jgi:hypothetical protein